jgi:hypothetical protein
VYFERILRKLEMDAFAERAQVTEKMPLGVKSFRVPQFLSYWLFKVESTTLKFTIY